MPNLIALIHTCLLIYICTKCEIFILLCFLFLTRIFCLFEWSEKNNNKKNNSLPYYRHERQINTKSSLEFGIYVFVKSNKELRINKRNNEHTDRDIHTHTLTTVNQRTNVRN